MAAIRETTYARQRLIGLLGKAESVLAYLKGGRGSGNFAPGQGRGVGKPNSGNLGRNVSSAIVEIRGGDIERAIILDSTGQRVAEYTGTDSAVMSPFDLANIPKDSTVIHNHPHDSSFSSGDFDVFVNSDARTSIVVTSKKIYILSKPQEWNSSNVRTALSIYDTISVYGLMNKVAAGLGSRSVTELEWSENTAKTTAEILGLVYRQDSLPIKFLLTKHLGPGNHPSGSSQGVHGRRITSSSEIEGLDKWISGIGDYWRPKARATVDEILSTYTNMVMYPLHRSYYGRETFGIGMHSPLTDTVEERADEYGKKFVDTSLENDLSYSKTIPSTFEELQSNPNISFRGMQHEEMAQILSTGEIQSTGDYNFSFQGQDTFFSDRSQTAASYSGGFAPIQHQPTFGRPGYVIAVERREGQNWTFDHQVSEWAAHESISASQIVRVLESRLLEQGEGFVEITDRGSTGSRSSPGTVIVYRDITQEFMRALANAPTKHYGPGPHRSGSDQDAHGRNRTTRVGITSQSTRHPISNTQVFEDMTKFKKELMGIEGVTNVSIIPGKGAWLGGGEGTWVVSYDGNGKAIELLARTGAKFDQDAVLVYSQHKIPNGVKSLYVDYSFKSVLPVDRIDLENSLAAHGLQGWTWLRSGGKTTLRLVAVPQWGMSGEKLMEISSQLDGVLSQVYGSTPKQVKSSWVTLMELKGDSSYDSFIH